MLYLLVAGAAIVAAIFSLVFGLDRRAAAKRKKILLISAAICAIIAIVLVIIIMKNPLI